MKFVLITGSSGLIGSECCEFFIDKKFKVIGIDNDSRKKFFGIRGSTQKRKQEISKLKDYKHHDIDILNSNLVEQIFKDYKNKIKCIIHCAAQPSHDWAYKNPILDYKINSSATLNLLLNFKKYCPDACFINMSTNKVYGDNPNKLKFKEKKFRYEVDKNSSYFKNGIDENMSLDNCVHSLFGVSKLSSDLYVQEFGKNYNLKTVTFRGGCLTGENQSGVELHGFLSYLVESIMMKKVYKVFGYKGKQVRDNIYSRDLISCFWNYYLNPRPGEIYNIGGGRENSCSILEVINYFKVNYNILTKTKYYESERVGDHIWWISDLSKFKKHYPNWKLKYSLDMILDKIALNFQKN